MSVIVFKCDSERVEEVKQKFWSILHSHYSGTVFPNTHVKYENEGEDVYAKRLSDLMTTELCNIEETEDGLRIEFDSTEDAGFSIASSVYGTGMGYSDEGLTYLKPLFDEIVNELPDVSFEAECECYDKWVSDEYHCSYDGENFECDAEWMDYEE